MNGRITVIQTYQQVLANFKVLQELAGLGDWNEVVRRQSLLLADLELIQQIEHETDLSKEDALERMAIIREIAKTRNEVKANLVKRKLELEELLRKADIQAKDGFGHIVTTNTYGARDVNRTGNR